MPTLKQKALIKKIIENPRQPLGQSMIEVGYSPNTAVHPQDVTKSKGWNELLEIMLPDDKILKVHDAALEATKVISARVTGKDADSNTDDFIDVPDHQTRLKAVELAYKVKHKIGNETNVAVQVNTITPDKLQDDRLENIIT